jgi:uncharacterized protein YeaO (DUF488 family)
MTEVAISENDERSRREIFTNVVLPRWLQRCNNRCLDLWNKTIGPAQGIVAQAAK